MGQGTKRRHSDARAKEAESCSALDVSNGHSSKKRRLSKPGDSRPPESPTGILDLPVEMLMSIFGRLGSRALAAAAQTCSRWRDLMDDPSLWRGEVARIRLDSLTAPEVDSLNRRGLQRVQVLSCGDPGKLGEFLAAVSTVRSVDLSKLPSLGDAQVSTCFRHELPSLEELSLPFRGSGQCDDAFASLTNLKVLNLHDEGRYVFDGVVMHLKELTSLRFFTLHGGTSLDCTILSVSPMPRLVRLCLEPFFLNKKDVEKLVAGLPNLKGVCIRLSNKPPTQTLAAMSSLEELRLWCNHPGETLMKHLSEGIKNLKVFHLLSSYSITEEDATHLAGMSSLEELELQHATDRVLEILSGGLWNLRRLYLQGCTPISDAGVGSVASMAGLQHLSLRSVPVSNEGLRRLSEGLPDLRWLEVTHSRSFNKFGIGHVARMPALSHLRLEGCSIGDKSMKYLHRAPAPLAHVNIWQCNNVSDRGLGILSLRCRVTCSSDRPLPKKCVV